MYVQGTLEIGAAFADKIETVAELVGGEAFLRAAICGKGDELAPLCAGPEEQPRKCRQSGVCIIKELKEILGEK